MEKNSKLFVAVVAIMLTLFFSWVFFSAKNKVARNLAIHFNGVVQDVTYDVKGIPSVTLNGKIYYLSAWYYFNHEIEKGDRLEKDAGSNVYRLTKRGTKKIRLFNN